MLVKMLRGVNISCLVYAGGGGGLIIPGYAIGFYVNSWGWCLAPPTHIDISINAHTYTR